MTENLLQFIWQNQLFDKKDLKTQNNEPVKIIHQGFLNSNAGADFSMAKIKIGEIVWVGDVEIHLRSSDWYRHHHDKNEAYRNVILHVVGKADKEINLNSGKLQQLELKIPENLLANYQYLQKNKHELACQEEIVLFSDFELKMWLERMLIERMEDKTLKVFELLKQVDNDWNECFYRLLLSNFGFKTNILPFEMLALSLPYKIIAKHRDQIKQVEALLFGQAGLLDENIDDDDYFNDLKTEYNFLRKKYGLKSINKSIWKFARMRPANFPTIRLAQLAQIFYHNETLFSKLIVSQSNTEIQSLFIHPISNYWQEHYLFGKKSKQKIKNLGSTSLELILINTIIPLLFAYGKRMGKQEIQDLALEIIEKLPAENNKIVRIFTHFIKIKSAADSQALIQLYNNYCKQRNCEKCNIGHKIITKKPKD